jgi:hypothetical protein
MKYGKSEEFKELLNYCESKKDELISTNRDIIKTREKINII